MAKMKVELEGAVHPDKGSIERALPGVNRRFDGMEKAMKDGFSTMEKKLRQWRLQTKMTVGRVRRNNLI